MADEYAMFGGDSPDYSSIDWSNPPSWITSDPNYQYILTGEDASGGSSSSGISSILDSILKGGSAAVKYLSSPAGAGVAGLAGGILGLINPSWGSSQQQPVGYTGGIPSYTAVREQVPGTYDPNRRPGSRGQEYFTNTQFVAPDQAATAQAQAAQDAQAAEARNRARTTETKSAPPRQDYAAGGLANLAQGSYLAGATDGMADKIPATIANQQPAKLSHGEFVIPADVVSHLGNGNSEAGAQRLYSMMDKVRQARTGTKKQGKQINPNKFMPG